MTANIRSWRLWKISQRIWINYICRIMYNLYMKKTFLIVFALVAIIAVVTVVINNHNNSEKQYYFDFDEVVHFNNV